MAVVGLSRSETRKLCPKGVFIACNNAKDSVVVSGPMNAMKEMIKTLEEKAVFVRRLQSSEIPYHSQYLISSAQPMTDAIKKYIPNPKPRTRKWVSTSLMTADPEEQSLKYASAEYFKYIPNPKPRTRKWVSTSLMTADPEEQSLKYASAEYFVYNLMNPVNFYDKFKDLPTDAIVLELGPHSLFGKITTETLDNSTYVSLIKKDSNDTNLDMFLSGLATLYELGYNLSVENLYPRVEWPVARNTPSINSLIKWDHSTELSVRKYPEWFDRSNASDMNYTVNCKDKGDRAYLDHAVDGNPIFPATGYLMLAWRKLAASVGKLWYKVPVVFENVQLKRATFLSDEKNTKLKVKYYPLTDDFSVYENDNLCVVGKIRAPGDDVLIAQNKIHENENKISLCEYKLERDDIYKELRVMGLDYGPEFRRLRKVGTNDFKEIYAVNEWTGNWVTYMDAVLQSMAFAMPFRKLMVPVMIRKLRVDPRVLFDAIKRNKIEEQEVHKGDKDDTEIERELKATMDQDADEHREGSAQNIESKTDKEKETYSEVSTLAHKEMEKAKERWCMYPANMPVYANITTKQLVAHGIEVEEVMAFPIPRRIDTTDLVLDSSEFCANDDHSAIDTSLSVNVSQYIELCKSMAAKVKQMAMNMKCDFNYKSISDDVIQEHRNANNENHVMFRSISDDVIQEHRNSNNENHVMFRVFDKILTEMVDQNMNPTANKDTKQTLTEIQANPEYDMSKDVINQISRNERMIRSLVDIVCENYLNISKNERMIRSLVDIVCENYLNVKEIKVTEINLSQSLLAKEVDQFIYLFKILQFMVDYNLVVKSKQAVNEVFREKATEWDPKDSLPINPSNLVIMRDTPDLWPIDLQTFIGDLYDSIQTNGFLLTVFRYKFTEPEIALNSMNGNPSLNDSELTLRLEKFITIAKSAGLRLICSKCDTIGTGGDYEKWFGLLQERLIEAKEADNVTEPVWLVANDSSINGIIGLMNCLRLEPGGENFRYIFNYDSNSEKIDFNVSPYSDILANDLVANVVKEGKTSHGLHYSDILANDLVANVVKEGKVGTYRHLRLLTDYDKCLSNDYYLNSSKMGDLGGLQWNDSRNIPRVKEMWGMTNNRETLTRVEIYCSGISFRDVMLATGRIPSGPEQLFTDCSIGYEYAGRRADTGERVMGLDVGRTFATSLNATLSGMTKIPDHWSMADASTIINYILFQMNR
ncbi:unnamed protein product [Oppiella nova]|uniref:PKS/mFAS DH domain-containing protein n=1 Tax=Oppiella nova TaxID=334625 RepID=A0A7R9MA96_9ACAR|nr:unnamed protein product [Oppiella nova]CAG2173426.1 unnamed protein product [Oppiella nova]